jgi:hypothetical protein
MLANFICNIFFVILDYRAAPILGTYHSTPHTPHTPHSREELISLFFRD